MEDAVAQGKVRAIGVSNFTVAHLGVSTDGNYHNTSLDILTFLLPQKRCVKPRGIGRPL